MMQILLLLVLVFATAATWHYILGRLRLGLPILVPRRRRPDPWGLLDVLLFIAVVAVSARFLIMLVEGDSANTEPITPAIMFAFGSGELIGCAIAIVFIFARHGIPLDRIRWDRRRIQRDLSIGFGAFAAMVLPISMLQAVLRLLFESKQHPLVDMVNESGAQGMLAAAFTAMVAAPITEELLFRMLLQGSLESWDMRTQWTSAVPVRANTTVESNHVPSHTRRGAPLWPMVLSAALFAVAHGGHGTDPIPLFPLALALGYLYRQTHRIAPCIIMHACHNSLSILLLWMQMRAE